MTIYSNPERYGLVVYGDAWRDDLSYEYDAFIIWLQPSTGAYMWASDSGCSCPMPFEDFHLGNLPVGSLRDALTDLLKWVDDDYSGGGRASSARGLIDRVRADVEAGL